MTKEEAAKLKDLVRLRYAKSEREGQRWDDVLVNLGLPRESKLLHIVIGEEEGLVKIEDPEGRYIKIPLETAQKMLVLGIP